LSESIQRMPANASAIARHRSEKRTRTVEFNPSLETEVVAFSNESALEFSMAPQQRVARFSENARRRKSLPVLPVVPLSSLTEEGETSPPTSKSMEIPFTKTMSVPSTLLQRSRFPGFDTRESSVLPNSAKVEFFFPGALDLPHTMSLPIPRASFDKRPSLGTTLSDDTDESGVCSVADFGSACVDVVDGRVDISHIANLLCHTSSLALHEKCCRALGAIASIGAEFQDAVVTAGGIDAIIAAMRMHSDSAGFLTAAISALFDIIFDRERNAQVAEVDRVAGAVKSAMKEHGDSVSLRKEARRVLGELALSGA
jgi:hypothetical protein